MVAAGEVTTWEGALATGLPIREAPLVDRIVPGLSEEVIDISMVQRMTDSGRRVKFRATVAVGNKEGFIGIGGARDAQVGGAVKRAAGYAKLNLVQVDRGCGSWECGCSNPHSVPIEVVGEAGSVRITLMPAPRGLGLAAAETAKKVLRLAGIRDSWTRVDGESRNAMNFAKATYDALKRTRLMKGAEGLALKAPPAAMAGDGEGEE
jgi:small subunit ribosomal protein S5